MRTRQGRPGELGAAAPAERKVADATVAGFLRLLAPRANPEVRGLLYVTLHEGASVTEGELIEFVRQRLARFKVPKKVIFGALPKTSTGKIQKYLLRQAAWSGAES